MYQPDLYKTTIEGREIEFSFAVLNGSVLTMDKSFHRYDHGMVLIAGNNIVYAGDEQKGLVEEIPPSSFLNAKGGIIIPGLINTHTHIGMSFFRSLADDKVDRLRKYIFPMEREFVTPELVYWASLHTISEMILGGTTTFADMYYYEEMTAKATAESGLRAVLGESVTSEPCPDSSGADESIEKARELNRVFGSSKRIIPGIAPHAPYSLSRKDLELVAAFAAEEKVPILSHLAEMPFEEAFIKEKHGMRPIPYYDACGLLTSNATMAHCIFANQQDRKLLVNRKTGIAHNAAANSKSGKGIAPAYEFFIEGARIGIGTDGPMSGNTMDLVHQLGAVSRFQKVRLNNPALMTPIQVMEMATIGGARALHLEKKTGSIESGKRADITIFSIDAPSMFPVYDPYAALVYSASPSDVSSVIVDGEVLMKERKLLHMDTAGIREAALSYTDTIREKINRTIPGII